ncbi:hypothetical protein HDU98_001963 [Podochytrium sp. JEL0797]|nr:hypothetical protein HDU98_001963 [Podochytrium sp. JEL0797]
MDSATHATLFNRDNLSMDTKPPAMIPIIDFSHFLDPAGLSSDAAQTAAEEMVTALSRSGFVYLKNHGIPKETIEGMFELSKGFFAQSVEEKNKVVWENPEANRGYVGQGVEKLSDLDKEGRADEIKTLNEISPDLKEAFDVGLNDATSPHRNRYPTPEFGTQCDTFFETMQQMNLKIMTAIAVGLGLPPAFFQPAIRRGTNTLRMLHYPACDPAAINETSRRCGAHTDYGSVTFLFQDQVGGLEVLDSSLGEFVRAVPVADTIVVNVGDLLQRWTNDYLKSNQHRVVRPYVVGEDGKLPARYSMAYFCDPDFEFVVETIPKFVTGERPNKYAPIAAGEHLLERLRSTYV